MNDRTRRKSTRDVVKGFHHSAILKTWMMKDTNV